MSVLLTKMKRIYRNSTISQKFFLAFNLMIAIPAIVVSFLFIRVQETQVYNEAMAAGNSHVSRLNEQIRNRMEMIESVSSTALKQKAFVDFIHTDMRGDGLSLVRFRQNQYELMHNIIQGYDIVSELSFYVDNPDLQEIWPEIYHYDRLSPQDFWMTLRDEGGSLTRLHALQDGEETLAYYRLVRLQDQQQRRPTIMEIRSPHRMFFRDLLQDGTNGQFFSIVMDRSDPARTVYHSDHRFVSHIGAELETILQHIHQQLDVLQQLEPVVVEVNDQTYYALYRYIPPLQAYVVDIASHQELMKGPRNLYLLVVAITCAVLLMMMLLVSLTTRRLFRRLDNVLVSMRSVRTGQLDAKIDTGLASDETGDEIDEVAISYNNMLDEIKRLMTQVVDKQLIAKNAQLHSLHSQINSHFLYNALESIRMLAEVERQPAIADALVSLGSLMRYSMKWRSDTVALSEELANIHSYIHFINFMEEGSFELVTNIPQEMLRYAIPKMCMQPIVENVVHHAFSGDSSVRIEIKAWVEQDRQLLIAIRDDGIGVKPETLTSLQMVLQGNADTPIVSNKNGLGLENVHKRLQLHYGSDNGLSIDSKQGEGSYTCVTIRLPWENVNLGGW